MKLLIAAALAIAYCSLANNQPLLATSAACNQAMRQAKVQLETVKSLKTYRAPAAAGSPASRPMSVMIALTAEKSMNNEPLQMGISKTIINKCSNVGSVSFAVYETDWVNVYGLVNSRVRRFTCKEAGQKIRWGEQYCL